MVAVSWHPLRRSTPRTAFTRQGLRHKEAFGRLATVTAVAVVLGKSCCPLALVPSEYVFGEDTQRMSRYAQYLPSF